MLRSEDNRAIQPRRVYIGTETTGLYPDAGDELLSLAVTDEEGKTLFNERFRPESKREWPAAYAVNHISFEDVSDTPTFAERAGASARAIGDGSEVCGYNVAFDLVFLAAAGLDVSSYKKLDAANLFMTAAGEKSEGRRFLQTEAADMIGYERDGPAYDALADVQAHRAITEWAEPVVETMRTVTDEPMPRCRPRPTPRRGKSPRASWTACSGRSFSTRRA